MLQTLRASLLPAAMSAALLLPPVGALAGDAGPDPAARQEAAAFFETRIRPLFAQNCIACHRAGNAKGELRLDTEEAFRKGGESGPPVDAADPGDSLLLRVLRYDGPVKMPPAGRLGVRQIQSVEAWVRAGAAWGSAPPAARAGQAAGAARPRGPHWAFQPVRRPPVPAVRQRDWPAGPIDRFVLARLEAAGLRPAPPASQRELIRRAAFDLTGLPPTPEETERFVADPSPAAYARVLDGYLASPRFGEKWGRMWLDVVRFAQTNGYERDDEKPHIWRYRDYVIRSFNQDRPYDRFLREQIAGDELPDRSDDSLVATGFYRLGVWDDEPDDAVQAEFDNLDDVLSTMGQAFLGLTVGCARCHDHKFDPMPQSEYYSLLAFIRNVRKYEVPDAKEKKNEHLLFADLSDGGKAQVVREYGPEPLKTRVLIRGTAATPGSEVGPAYPAMLGARTPEMPPVPAGGQTTGRRTALAAWVTDPVNPLTARVIVNRAWQSLFGRGLVTTPNDFGHSGLPPSHPELLDYLASEITARGWRLKPLIREVMLSAAYRQSSRSANPAALERDPDNTLLWRHNLRRLPAEAIRDSILAVNGTLNLQTGGRGIFPTLPPEVLSTQSRPGNGWTPSTPEEQARRSVYIFAKRTLGVPFLESFDAPVPDSSVAARPTTTIAPQALVLLNSTFMDEQARAFAARLLRGAAGSSELVAASFRLALQRSPTQEEQRVGEAFLTRRPSAGAASSERLRAVADWCKVVLNLNEFLYVD